ncbi:glypican-6-like isoform X2 [Podarcis raffonei]|uniref:glypican-6-like isoform X2 n=1 Tax=Podarcis raffonei TaxID=65483 RepID=UPI0023296EB4|nr:glypican-6-like isoform X2 [Podarcis raffonei]
MGTWRQRRTFLSPPPGTRTRGHPLKLKAGGFVTDERKSFFTQANRGGSEGHPPGCDLSRSVFCVTDNPPGISGEHLRICPQEYTCCASETEERLSEQSRGDLQGLVGEAAGFLLSTLGSRQRRFQDFFRELLAGAEQSLQAMFTRSYGRLYAQHARLFQGLFVELRRHLQGARPGLDEALSDFWARLLERMLPLLNPQYNFPESYLECVGHQAEGLRAFGDSPRQLRVQVTRAFIAARAFVQGLATGRDVVVQAVKLSPSGECRRAHMRLSYCPLCRGTPALKPCNGFCLNVMKGCFASAAELDPEWERFLDALTQLAERLGGPFNFELAADSIGVKISEAIMFLQEHSVQISAKVFQSCGSPRPAPARSRRSPREEAKRRFRTYLPEEKPTTAAGTNLDRLVLDVKEKLRLMRRFWVMLPHALCSDEKVAADVTNEDSCWNGQARGRYLPDVTGDGLVNQINNPEVEVDISRPDMPTRQHVLALRSATSRLVGACNGQDLDFQDADEDGGSGSGAGYSEDRPALGAGGAGGSPAGSRPSSDARPPRRERPGKGSSSSRQNQSGGRPSSGAGLPPTGATLQAKVFPPLFLLLLLGGW